MIHVDVTGAAATNLPRRSGLAMTKGDRHYRQLIAQSEPTPIRQLVPPNHRPAT